MGIFGFGVLRDRFASVVPHATIARLGYVACFDITPIVVYAIRHSANEDEFAELFRRRMDSSKEVHFLRNNPPYALCYTLDNRAPLAKRQTQIQRLLDARPIVARLTAVVAATPTTATVRGVLRIRDVVSRIREILMCDFVLTTTAAAAADHSSRRRRHDAKKSKTAVADPYRYRRIEFDYDEGEGEIKAINWLTEHGSDGRLRLIMARDNDVFVYILSKLHRGGGGGGGDDWRCCSWRTHDELEPNSYLMYHEGSNDVLLCWQHLRAYYDRCWVLLLWMSVCFGNDFAFGILDKSVNSVSRYYPLLERHFIAVNPLFKDAVLNGGGGGGASCEDERISACLTTAFRKLRDALRCDRDERSRYLAVTDLRRTIDSKSSSSDEDNDDDEYVRLWIARQLWSFFYILELPSEFTKNQRFRICPTLPINASFDKPFMSSETFMRLRDVDFQRHIESVVRYGL